MVVREARERGRGGRGAGEGEREGEERGEGRGEGRGERGGERKTYQSTAFILELARSSSLTVST